jgi:predicted metal-dependent phosphoesterase TrpH
VTWEGSTVHIVGLRIDPENPVLLSGLESIREGRATRAEKMGEALAAAGVPDSLAGAKVYAENPSLISRSHFARHLVKTGRAPDVKSVFQRYLVKGKPGFVPHRWASLGDAVSWIRASGGIAVVAHPGRYNFSKPELHAFLAEFRDCGGAGNTPNSPASRANSASPLRAAPTITARGRAGPISACCLSCPMI